MKKTITKSKKGYSEYQNPKSNNNNQKKVKKGSVIVAKVSDYDNLPKHVKDHKRESIVVLKDAKEELGVVFLHGKQSVDGRSREKKKEAGIYEEITKNGQAVYVDIDIRVTDSKGNPIKQGRVFQNTGVMITPEEMEKVEKHLYEKQGRKSHAIRKILTKNQDIKAKEKCKINK